MIMEDFVPFEIAKKLKEKGFVQGFNVYGIRPIYYNPDTIKFISDIGAYEAEYFGENISCPTISQVLKWLREEKGYHVCISLGEFSDWVYDISKIEGNVFCEAMDDFHSYEQAALAGIEYTLENII
jgi:hypothetical protein